MTALVLIHGGESTGKKLRQVMPEASVYVIYHEGSSSAYDERTGLAHDYPTLEELLAEYAPDWAPGEPLVLLGYSAGAWALRYYLRDPHARELVSAAIFLDGLYGKSDGSSLSVYEGVVEFGRMAQAEPSQHRLIMTYSKSYPGPDVYSPLIAAEAGGESASVIVRGYQNKDHGAQQGVVGPAMVEEYVAGWIGGVSSSADGGGSRLGLWLGLGAAVLALGWWLGRR